MSELKQGLKPLTPDSRDYSLGAIIDWPKLEEVPKEYFVEPLSIKNQLADNNEDFCASCAGTGMIEPKEETELFYPYLFAAAKYESGDDPNSWGLSIKDVGKALTKWGVPEIKDVPDEIKNLPPDQRRRFENYPESLRQAAAKHKAKTYFFVEGSPYDPYDSARAALWYFRIKKQQIIFGVHWGWPLEKFTLDGTPDGFGHALWVCGWYENSLRVVNSAGKEAGVNGQHAVSRETFNTYAEKYGLMMIVDLDREDAEHYLANNIKLNDPWWRTIIKPIFNFLHGILASSH